MSESKIHNETILLVCLFVFVVYIFYTQNTQNFENFTNDQQDLANKLVQYLHSNPDYISYLGFLNDNRNASQNLIVKSNFTNLLSQAQNNTLTVANILNTM
jgi:predicted PurR-regulated permease PerM